MTMYGSRIDYGNLNLLIPQWSFAVFVSDKLQKITALGFSREFHNTQSPKLLPACFELMLSRGLEACG